MAPSRKRKAVDSSESTMEMSSVHSGHTSGRTNKRAKTTESTATSDGESNKTTFMSLPGELRNEIYRLTLVEDKVIHIRPRKRRSRGTSMYPGAHSGNSSDPTGKKQIVPWREPGILQVSHSVRRETSALYYKSNAFQVSLHFVETEHAVNWVQSIIRRCGNDPFKHFSFYITRLRWTELKYARPFAMLYMEHDLVLRPMSEMPGWAPGIHTYDHHGGHFNSLFHTKEFYVDKLWRTLEEVVELGKRARQEGWSQDWFDLEFLRYYDEKMDQEGAKAHRDVIRYRRRKALYANRFRDGSS